MDSNNDTTTPEANDEFDDDDGAEGSGNPYLSRAFKSLYTDLHKIAHRRLLGDRARLEWQTTDLVHQAFLKLSSYKEIDWSSDVAVLKNSAWAMRVLVIDHARQRIQQQKYGVAAQPLAADPVATSSPLLKKVITNEQLDRLDRALDAYRRINPDNAAILELNQFGGYSYRQIATDLNISLHQVRTAIRTAKAMIYSRLHEHSGNEK